MSSIVIFIGIILILQLVNLQIVKGEEYRFNSQSRLFREASVQAPRGEIYDRNNRVLARNREAFHVQIIKTSVEPDRLNQVLLSLIKVLEKNGDSYRDNFPLNVDPVKLDLGDSQDNNGSKVKRFKEQFKVKKKDITDKELFEHIRSYYQIPEDFSTEEARKVIALRYEMTNQAASQFDPVTVAVDVSKQTVAELEERHIDFPGISIMVEPVREYPNGSVASHVLGYIGKIDEKEYNKLKDKGYKRNDLIGKDGLEKSLEGLLRGKSGLRKVEVDTKGRLTGEIGGTSPEPGDNIYLSLDIELQKVAEKALKETIDKISSGGYKDTFPDAKSGAVVVMDAKRAEVLALASYPCYDPSMFVKGISYTNWNKLMLDQQKPMYNKAIKGTYSPGSTFKMVTAIAALHEQRVSTDEYIRDEGVYTRYTKDVDDAPKCWIWKSGHRTHGNVNVVEALKVSCNYFFYEMGYRTGIDRINKYTRMFGLGQKTGIELPGESTGIIAGPEYKQSKGDRWYPGHTLSAAIGQSDYAFTPVQMANYIATLVNGGNRNKPYLVSRVTTWNNGAISEEEAVRILDDKDVSLAKSTPVQLNLNQTYVNAVLEGMKSVTGDQGGTAYGTFANFPKSVGGKTGTVQATGSDHAWFVGFAPYENPEIVVAVIIEHGGHGSYTASVARDIIAKYYGFYSEETGQ